MVRNYLDFLSLWINYSSTSAGIFPHSSAVNESVAAADKCHNTVSIVSMVLTQRLLSYSLLLLVFIMNVHRGHPLFLCVTASGWHPQWLAARQYRLILFFLFYSRSFSSFLMQASSYYGNVDPSSVFDIKGRVGVLKQSHQSTQYEQTFQSYVHLIHMNGLISVVFFQVN